MQNFYVWWRQPGDLTWRYKQLATKEFAETLADAYERIGLETQVTEGIIE